MRLYVVFMACIGLTVSLARADDPIKVSDDALKALAAGKAAYEQELTTLKGGVLAALDEKEKDATTRGKAKDVQAIRDERDAFDEGAMPQSVGGAARKYLEGVKTAKNKVIPLYVAAEKSLTQASLVKESLALAKEREQFEKGDVAFGSIKKGAVFEGVKDFGAGSTCKATFEVLSRKGDRFTGKITVFNTETHVATAEGKIANGSISMTTQAGGHQPPQMKGKVVKDKFTFGGDIPNRAGKIVEVTFDLDLQPAKK